MTVKIIDNLWECLKETEKELKENPCFDLHRYMIMIVNEMGVKVPNYERFDYNEWKELVNKKIEKLLNEDLVSEPFMIKSIVSFITDDMKKYNEATIRNLQMLLYDAEKEEEKEALKSLKEKSKTYLDPMVILQAKEMLKCWQKNVDKHLNDTVYDMYISDYGWPIFKK